MLKWTLIVG